MSHRIAVVDHDPEVMRFRLDRCGPDADWGYGPVRYLSKRLHGCPCGYAGDAEKECTCSPTLISCSQKRLSGPLLDRTLAPALRSGASAGVDIHIEVPRVPFQKLSDDRRGEPSAAIRGRVKAARARPTVRFAVGAGLPARSTSSLGGAKPAPIGLTTNADMSPTEVRDHCEVDEAGRQLLGTAMRHTCPGTCPGGQRRGMHLGARAYHRILKLACTIGDLAGAQHIQPAHIAEAIQYRPRRQGQSITRRRTR